MKTRKKNRISKAWVATPEGPRQHKVVLQPLGEWCVTLAPETGTYTVTHLPTGMAGFATYDLKRAHMVLGAWAVGEKFTLATWTKTLANRLIRARDEALAP